MLALLAPLQGISITSSESKSFPHLRISKSPPSSLLSIRHTPKVNRSSRRCCNSWPEGDATVPLAPIANPEKETMKRLLILCTILSSQNLILAQGIQGNVKLTGKATVVTTGHSVNLTWNPSPGATSYCVYRGTAHGQYAKIASGIAATNYSDVHITHNQTLYYVTTAVNGSSESGYSNEIVAVIP